jgi:superfamily II DNA or RNA helicase
VPVEIVGDTLQVHFTDFGLESYSLFLACKRLPESQTEFVPEGETYRITAPARFAPLLGVELPKARAQDLPISRFLFDDQRAVVRMAMDAKRFACWSGCGLGKTIVGLEWARHVRRRTAGRILIVTLNEIIPQWIDEANRWYGKTLPLLRLASRNDMRQWMKAGDPGVAITNYEKWNPAGLSDQVVNEARHLAGIALDESSRLKGSGGKQKWALIHSSKGIEYKLSLTATPAPNDTIEFASQASFLEKMRTDKDIIWTFFTRDPKSHRWVVKPHARTAFFEFMASWSIYINDPKRYGWRKGMEEVPEPEMFVHEIEPTVAQREHLARLTVNTSTGQMDLFGGGDTNAIQRGRLSQVAKGFLYRKKASGRGTENLEFYKGDKGRLIERIPSQKPIFITRLVASEVDAGLQVLIWTVFDAESSILSNRLREAQVPHELLTGDTRELQRLSILERFRKGESSVLISRAALLGYGMNLQACGSMIFSGWTDSFESYYQAVRRAYRYGQKKRLRVHMPIIRELEGDTLENIFRKQSEHNRSIEEMEANYIRAIEALKGKAG